MPPADDVAGSAGRLAWLLPILALAFTLRLGLALGLPNLHRPDEMFQNLEPAFRMWSGAGVVSWEWREGIRSPVFPGFLAAIIALSSQAGMGPRGYLAAISAVLSLLSTSVVAIGFLEGWRRAGRVGGVICGALCTFWPDLVYFGPKPLAEVQAGNLLLVAAYLAAHAGAAGSSSAVGARRTSGRMFVAGVLLGLVFCLRFQLAPALGIVAAWTCRLELRARWLPMALGLLIPATGMGLVDLFTWGSLFHSVWRSFQINIGQGVSNEFGVRPPLWFLGAFIREWGASLALLAVAFRIGVRRAPLLAAIAAVVVASHSVVAHKEISFVYAALPPALVVAGLGMTELAGWFARVCRPGSGGTVAAAMTACCVVVGVLTGLGGGFAPLWFSHAAILHAEAAMRSEMATRGDTGCGLGVRWPKLRWFWTAGDAYLGRPVPIYAFGSVAGIARVAPAIDYAVGGDDVAEGLPGFSVLQCWDSAAGNVCLAHSRPGKVCTADPGFDLNSVSGLGRLGQEQGADHP